MPKPLWTNLKNLKKRLNIGIDSLETALGGVDVAMDVGNERGVQQAHAVALAEIKYTEEALQDARKALKLYKAVLSTERRAFRQDMRDRERERKSASFTHMRARRKRRTMRRFYPID